MLTGKIVPTLLTFALPVLGTTILQSLSLTIAQFWIARTLDVNAITAAGNANVLMGLMLSAFIGLAMAGNIMVARSVGSANWPLLKRVVGTTSVFLISAALVVAILGYLLAPQIVTFVGAPPEARAGATAYLRILAGGIPLTASFSFLQMAQQSTGDSRRPFYFMLLAICLNLILNPLLISGLGPIPAFGVSGAAIATVAGQSAALIAGLIYIHRSDSPIAIRRDEFRYFRPDREIMMALVTRGLPITGNTITWQISAAIMIGMVNHYGPTTAAAYTASNQIWNYLQMPAMALGNAATAMAAQNIGAGDWGRVNRIAASTIVCGLCLTAAISTLLYLFLEPALHIFLPSGSAALTVAAHINIITMWSFCIYSISLQLIGIVRSSGAVWPAMAVSFASLVCARIAFAKFLSPVWGADAIWWSFPVGFACSASLHALYFRFGGWRNAQMLKSDGGQAPLRQHAHLPAKP